MAILSTNPRSMDQPFLESRQRPVFDRLRRRQDADRHAAVFGGRINPTMYKACAGVAPPPQTA
jgi:hypothetical protein